MGLLTDTKGVGLDSEYKLIFFFF